MHYTPRAWAGGTKVSSSPHPMSADLLVHRKKDANTKEEASGTFFSDGVFCSFLPFSVFLLATTTYANVVIILHTHILSCLIFTKHANLTII
jgi:hypothetical protein